MATATAADPRILASGPWPLAMARGPTRARATSRRTWLKAQNCETVVRGVPDLATVWEKLKLKAQNCETVARGEPDLATVSQF